MKEQVLIREMPWISGGWWYFKRVDDENPEFIYICRNREERIIHKTFVQGWRLS